MGYFTQQSSGGGSSIGVTEQYTIGVQRDNQVNYNFIDCIACDNCNDICINNAILFINDNGKPTIDYNKCQESKYCVRVCPTGALS